MELIELSSTDKKNYNQFVANSPSGSFLQSWEWGEWQSALGRQIFRYWILDNIGKPLVSIQLIKMSLPFGKFYLYAPYGPTTDLSFKIEDLRFLLKELQVKFNNALFIRIEPTVEILGLAEFAKKSNNIQPAITIMVDLRQDEEKILAGMHPKTRYNIKIAEKNQVSVSHELVVTPRHGLYIQEAVNLILETQKRQHYRGHSADYYKKLIDFFAIHNLNGDLKLEIYRAVYQKKLLVSAIIIDFGKIRMYLFGGSSEKDRNVMAPYALHWQAMLDAKKQGLELYDLGGSEVASGGEKGFTRFKRGFGGVVVEYVGAYDYVINKPFYSSYGLLRKANKLLKKISPK